MSMAYAAPVPRSSPTKLAASWASGWSVEQAYAQEPQHLHFSGDNDVSLTANSNPGAALDVEFQAFLRDFPGYDAATIDALRRAEFSRLDKPGLPSTYLDYTGGSLYAETAQLEAFKGMLRSFVLGNPHSRNPTSEAAENLVERARAAVGEYFRAGDQYEVIFTLNASNAVKLVGECYPFESGSLLLLMDNHNSVNGLREYAKKAGAAAVDYLPISQPELRASVEELERFLEAPGQGGRRLFAYPAQSNFSGVQHPLEWISLAQSKGWDVLLDAAAFVPTNRLDLSLWKPDFVDISFYKMFGYPTGVGALLVRKDKLPLLRRASFYGGTVDYVGVGLQTHVLKHGHGAFEDGTLDYLNIPAVELGLRLLKKVGIESVHSRVEALTEWLLSQLASLRHSTGAPVVLVYGPSTVYRRGGTLAVNFFTPSGQFVPHATVQQVFSAAGVSLRYGCFCNPGAFEAAVGLRPEAIVEASLCSDSEQRSGCILRHSGVTGAVRISMGLASTFADVHRFLALVREHFVDQLEAPPLGDKPDAEADWVGQQPPFYGSEYGFSGSRWY